MKIPVLAFRALPPMFGLDQNDKLYLCGQSESMVDHFFETSNDRRGYRQRAWTRFEGILDDILKGDLHAEANADSSGEDLGYIRRRLRKL